MNQILSEYSTWDETALSAVLKTCNMASLLGSRDKARCHSFHAILPILHVSIQSLYFFKRKYTDAFLEYPLYHVGLISITCSAS